MTEEIWFGKVKLEISGRKTILVEDLRHVVSVEHDRAADLLSVMERALRVGYPEIRFGSHGRYIASGRPTGDPAGSVVLVADSGRRLVISSNPRGLRRAAEAVNRAIVELVMVA